MSIGYLADTGVENFATVTRADIEGFKKTFVAAKPAGITKADL